MASSMTCWRSVRRSARLGRLGIARQHLHPGFARKDFDRFHETQVLGLLHEADGIAFRVAAEAIVIALAVIGLWKLADFSWWKGQGAQKSPLAMLDLRMSQVTFRPTMEESVLRVRSSSRIRSAGTCGRYGAWRQASRSGCRTAFPVAVESAYARSGRGEGMVLQERIELSTMY